MRATRRTAFVLPTPDLPLDVTVIIMLLAVFCSLFSLAVADTHLKLYHRLYYPVLEPERIPFTERGTLRIPALGTTAFLEQSELFDKDWIQSVPDVNEALYQVALERQGDESESQWDISSVKACHLPASTSDSIIVHVSGAGTPYALEYFVSPIPHDGACPKRSKSKSKSISQSSVSFAGFSNTTVQIKSPRLPPLPALRVPPPLSPEGAPIVPVPEKPFIQKYWMYIVAVLLALLLSGGGEEEKPARGQ